MLVLPECFCITPSKNSTGPDQSLLNSLQRMRNFLILVLQSFPWHPSWDLMSLSTTVRRKRPEIQPAARKCYIATNTQCRRSPFWVTFHSKGQVSLQVDARKYCQFRSEPDAKNAASRCHGKPKHLPEWSVSMILKMVSKLGRFRYMVSSKLDWMRCKRRDRGRSVSYIKPSH